MAKNKISEYSSTAASNTDVANINIAEGCSPSNINNAIRAVMSHLKNFQDGSSGDSVTVGGNLSVTGTTTLSGTATATTQSAGDNSTKLATTAYVDNEVSGLGTMSTQDANSVAITGGTVAATFTGNLTGNVTGNVTGNATTATTATTANALNTGNGYQASYLRLNTGSGSTAGYLYALGLIGAYGSSGTAGNLGAVMYDATYAYTATPGSNISGSGFNTAQPGTWRCLNFALVTARHYFFVRVA